MPRSHIYKEINAHLPVSDWPRIVAILNMGQIDEHLGTGGLGEKISSCCRSMTDDQTERTATYIPLSCFFSAEMSAVNAVTCGDLTTE